jgi:tetratricopeptide (TPR) repeat protein
VNMIEAYLQLGRHKELKEWFDVQIQANTKNNEKLATLYRWYSELYEILMDSKQAREYALRAVRLNPDNYSSYYHLGRLLYYSGDYEEAKKQLRLATKDENSSAVAHLYLALIADELGENDEKQKNIEIALGKNPYAFDYLLNRYYSRSKFYNYPGYIALIDKGYQDYLRINPNIISVKASYSRFLTNFVNNLELALRLNEECIEKEPETWWLLDDRAWILYRMGKYSEADQTITRFMQNENETNIDRWIWSFYHIGKIKIAVGDSVQGMEYLKKTRKFRDINPLDEFIVEDVKSILDSGS